MYRILSLVVILTLALYISSCDKSKSTEEGASSEEFEEAQAEQSVASEKFKDVIREIPSPSEIPYLLEATGAEYDASLVNSISRVDMYSNRNDKAALNLGVYSADVGYLVSYDKVQESLNYMSELKKLADNLGVSGAFDRQLVTRFEENLSNKDSLAYLLDESIQKVESYLRDDNRTRLAALMLSGSFVEGLYISTQLIENYPKDILPDDARNLILTPLIRVVIQQEIAVNDLLELLRNVEKTEPVNTLIEDLEELKTSYEKLDIQDQISNNRADLMLSNETLNEITRKVAEMRQMIVE